MNLIIILFIYLICTFYNIWGLEFYMLQQIIYILSDIDAYN
jgi:hypothetical protein